MKFDLHIHSKHSPDSNISIKDILDRAKSRGINGISITDHNSFNGSEEALMVGSSDVVIIPGAEYSTDQGHFLVYFLKKGLEKLQLKRDIYGRFHWQDILEAAHSQDAVVFIAHPYKPTKVYDPDIWNHIDGIEIYNSRASLSRNINANFHAVQTLKQYNKAFSAGSDAHWLGEIGHAFWEYPILQVSKSEDTLSLIKSALLSSTGKVWGSPSHRLYEPSSQILKGFKTSNYSKTIRPLAKMAYSCLLESARHLGFGKKAFEGWVELETQKGE